MLWKYRVSKTFIWPSKQEGVWMVMLLLSLLFLHLIWGHWSKSTYNLLQNFKSYQTIIISHEIMIPKFQYHQLTNWCIKYFQKKKNQCLLSAYQSSFGSNLTSLIALYLALYTITNQLLNSLDF